MVRNMNAGTDCLGGHTAATLRVSSKTFKIGSLSGIL